MRYAEGTLPTDYGFTGQRNEAGIGLMDYNARFYDPWLARFVSADTIVPSAGSPQSLNRYSYVVGNPLKYVDPSGHCIPGVNCPKDRKFSETGGIVGLEGEDGEGETTWADLYEAYDRKADEVDPEAWYGHQQMYFACKAVLYRHLAEGAPPEVIEAAGIRLAHAKMRLANVGYWGTDPAVESLYDSAGPAVHLAITIGIVNVASGSGPRPGTARYHQVVNKLKRIRNVEGNRTLSGTLTPEEADFLGRRWVGDGYSQYITKKGDLIFVSKDLLRQYRSVTTKDNPYTTTGFQANFESRYVDEGPWVNNAHIDVVLP